METENPLPQPTIQEAAASPSFEQTLEKIGHPELQQSVEQIISLGIQNADTVNYHELFNQRSLIQALSSPYAKESYLQAHNISADQFQQAQDIILSCIDASDYIGNNNLFSRARSLVFETAVINPADESTQRISPDLLRKLQDFGCNTQKCW